MTRGRAGWLSILGGAALALAVQIVAPVGVPLYDGVVVQEPYRFLHPTGDQAGEPTSFSTSLLVENGVTPIIVAATGESPPQAQLISQRDAFDVPPGVESIVVSITLIEPPALPAEGSTIASNVYRVSVTDEAGNPVPLKPCEACASLVLRAPEGTGEATVRRFAQGAWADVKTYHAGTVAMYQANPTALGDYAVIELGSVDGGDPVDLTLIVLGGGIALVFAAFIGLMFLRARPPRPPPYRPGRAGGSGGSGSGSGWSGRGALPGRVPSKRRGSKRPPSGRSGE